MSSADPRQRTGAKITKATAAAHPTQKWKWNGRSQSPNTGMPRSGYRHVYHLYVVETIDAADRDNLLNYLVANVVDAKTHYSIPIHKQIGYPWGKDAEIRGTLTNAEKNAASCISLPMFPELTNEEVDYCIQLVKAWKK